MVERILTHFPPHTHALTLVSDPDGLLTDEDVLTALSERGFTLVAEPDPVALRYRVETLRPWSVDRPVVVVTPGPLDRLPYDLWQQGHPVTLALHTFFPDLAYPVVRALTPAQRWRLSLAPPPPRRLGRRGTIEFLLRHVFIADRDALRQPPRLIAWLDRYHQRADPLPPVLAESLLASLRAYPIYGDWPLAELLADRDAFTAFVRDQWRAYLQQQTGVLLKEEPVRYLLDFARDHTLQDALPGLLRSGTLEPVGVDRPDRLPNWARPATLARDEDRRPHRIAELVDVLAEQLDASLRLETGRPRSGQALADARWEQWQAVARAWAELDRLRYDPDLALGAALQKAILRLQKGLDAAFLDWLRRRYGPLGSQRLPVPHHVHHVPHYVAYQRRQGGTDRVALLVLDGMALADWAWVGSTWRARHPNWCFGEHLLLAQIPTITAVSRQALVGGLRPADFTATLDTSRAEPKRWADFWAREGLSADACPHVHLALERTGPPPEVDSARTRALCLTYSKIDDMVHDATLGMRGFRASLGVWLEEHSRKLEGLIDGLLDRRFVVYVTSDHGHVQARGFGQPAEGLTVDTRGRRARVYSDRHAAISVQQGFSRTVLWSHDGLLPDDVWVLMPEGRKAFDTFDEITVTHGGLTLDEVVVPFVTITQGS